MPVYGRIELLQSLKTEFVSNLISDVSIELRNISSQVAIIQSMFRSVTLSMKHLLQNRDAVLTYRQWQSWLMVKPAPSLQEVTHSLMLTSKSVILMTMKAWISSTLQESKAIS